MNIILIVTLVLFAAFIFLALLGAFLDKDHPITVFCICGAGVLFVALLVVDMILGIAQEKAARKNVIYNEGHRWEYQQAVGHQYTTEYIYKCTDCGKIIETDELIDEVEE